MLGTAIKTNEVFPPVAIEVDREKLNRIESASPRVFQTGNGKIGDLIKGDLLRFQRKR